MAASVREVMWLPELEGVLIVKQPWQLLGSEIFIRQRAVAKTTSRRVLLGRLNRTGSCDETGVKLGKVDHLLETGANDVLVVVDDTTERLIPFLQQHTVLNVDLQLGKIMVDWDPDF